MLVVYTCKFGMANSDNFFTCNTCNNVFVHDKIHASSNGVLLIYIYDQVTNLGWICSTSSSTQTEMEGSAR